VFGEVFVAATPMGGGLRLAGTMEFSGINDRMVRKRLDLLVTGARQYLAGIDEAKPQSEWCGLRPCTPDGLPVVGWAPNVGGIFIATGHARMGFTLGPITGKLASECILDGEPSINIHALRVQRFRQPS
jgi:D-amino-acid dehydrogenase